MKNKKIKITIFFICIDNFENYKVYCGRKYEFDKSNVSTN